MLPSRGRVGLKTETGLVVPDRLLEFTLQTEDDSEIAMRVSVSRVDLDHLAQVRDRFIELVPRTEQHGEIEVRVGIVRIQLHSATELGDRLVRSS